MTRFSQGSLLNIGHGMINVERDLPPEPSSEVDMSTTDSRSSFAYSDSTTGGQFSKNTSQRRSSVVSPEVLELEDMIYRFKEQLDFHKRRADAEERRAVEAERKAREVTEHLKSVNKARILAVSDATRANQELKLYKLQLDTAQHEIIRAQGVFDLVERQKYAAEKQAAESRSRARRLAEELLVEQARREGRRLGMQEGLERGRGLREQEGPYLHTNQTSFMEDGYDSDDNRTVSTDSFDNKRSGHRSRYTTSVELIHSPSPPPVPIPEPRSVPQSQYAATPSVIESDIRPISIRDSSPTPRLGSTVVPPDNFIPHLDTDNVIRIPPPYEFQRPPPDPERQASPSLTGHLDGDEYRYRSGTPQQYRRRHSSPDSTSSSTTLSQLDMVKNPYVPASNTPALSVILEVNSNHTSPNPQSLSGQDLQHQRSMSARPESEGHESINDGVSLNQRPIGMHHNRSTSSLSSSIRHKPPSIYGQGSRRSNNSVHDTPIQINVQPPSRPISDGAQSILSKSTSAQQLSPLAADTVPLPGLSGNNTILPVTNTPGVHDRSPTGTMEKLTSYRDDDAVSSRLSEDDFFTTPPPSGVPRSWESPSMTGASDPAVVLGNDTSRAGWGLDSEFESNKKNKKKR